jgi:hypothetical protein
VDTPTRRGWSRRALVGVAITCALVVVACGDDDEGGSAEGFCDEMQDLDELVSGGLDDDPGVVLAALDRLDPPSELDDELDTLTEAWQALDDMGLDNPDPQALAAAGVDTDEVGEAADSFARYVEDECGIPS